jgi:carboxymethylenebutenolidase
MVVHLKDPDGQLSSGLSRRGLLPVFFAGFATAALSAQAEPIQTSSDGLITESVSIPLKDGNGLPAFVARPATTGRHPVVIVTSEIFGIHEYIRDICRRLARQGYFAIAPAFFFRAGDPAPLSDFTEIRKIVATATNAQVMSDLQAVIDWQTRQPAAKSKALGITGFCWGGGVVWMACATHARIKAGVAWYGRLTASQGSTSDPDRKYPVEIARDLKAPVLGLYGELDQGITQADIKTMRSALTAAGRHDEIIVYPGADHGFHADYRPSYNPIAATDGWERMLRHFRANGVA